MIDNRDVWRRRSNPSHMRFKWLFYALAFEISWMEIYEFWSGTDYFISGRFPRLDDVNWAGHEKSLKKKDVKQILHNKRGTCWLNQRINDTKTVRIL